MEEEKKTFKEKWKDKKYQAKVKLSGYGIFILIIILLLSIGGGNSSLDNNTNDDSNLNNDINYNEEENKIIFNKPVEKTYNYEISISFKENNVESNYYYHGSVFESYEEVVKEIDNISNTYRIKDEKYFALKNEKYILTTKEEIYDITDYDYLNVDNINNYLSYSKLIDNKYYVYLKDIILDINTDDYITFFLEDSKITIDYTNLINYLDNKEYDSYVVEISYKK